MKKSELKQLIKEEISKIIKESIVDDFKKDAKEAGVESAYIKAEGPDKIIVYLEDNPNKEINIINKIVRTKYLGKLVKMRSEEDVIIFKIK